MDAFSRSLLQLEHIFLLLYPWLLCTYVEIPVRYRPSKSEEGREDNDDERYRRGDRPEKQLAGASASDVTSVHA